MDFGSAIDHVWSVYMQAFHSPVWALAAIVATAGLGWIVFKGTGAWFAVWAGHHAVRDDIARSRIGDVEKQLQEARIDHQACEDRCQRIEMRADKDRLECDQRVSKIYEKMIDLGKR